MKLSVHHATVYRYAEPVSRSTQYIRLTPAPNKRQRVVEWQLQLAARAVFADGDPARIEAATEILNDARKRLYGLLAE